MNATNPTANETYQDRMKTIRALLAELDGALAQHNAEQQARPRDWSLVGDLGRVIESLEATIEPSRGE